MRDTHTTRRRKNQGLLGYGLEVEIGGEGGRDQATSRKEILRHCSIVESSPARNHFKTFLHHGVSCTNSEPLDLRSCASRVSRKKAIFLPTRVIFPYFCTR